MKAKLIQLSQSGVNKYPRTIDQAIAVVSKAKLLSTVLSDLGAEDLRLAELITAAENKIAVLNGSAEGSVDKKIADAIDKFATEVTDNGKIDKFKELVDHVANYGSEITGIVDRIASVENSMIIYEEVSEIEDIDFDSLS